MSYPNFIKEIKPSLFEILSSNGIDYYQVNIDNRNKLKCSCRAVEFGSDICVHKHIVKIMNLIEQKNKRSV